VAVSADAGEDRRDVAEALTKVELGLIPEG
jgi:hypothetical protein